MAKGSNRTFKKTSRPTPVPKQLSLFDDLPHSPIAAKPEPTPPRQSRRPTPLRQVPAVKPAVLTPVQAAELLGVKPATLKSWRAKGVGPDYVKRGVRLIGYFPAALAAFLRKSGGKKA
jgi:hypothetical protein